MRIALCLSGNVRTFKECVKSPYFQELVGDSSVDTYLTTWGLTYPLTACYPTDPMLIDIINEEELKDAYRTDHVKVYQLRNFYRDSYSVSNSLNYGRYEDYVSMHYMIDESFHYAAKNGKYDIIIRSRPDLFMLSELDIREANVFPTVGTIPRDGKILSFTDMFFYGKTDDMLKISAYSRIVPEICPVRHVPNYHERLFTAYIDALGIQTEFDETIRFQIQRPKKDHFTVGFFNLAGEFIDTPKIP